MQEITQKHHQKMSNTQKEPQPTTVFEYKSKFITEWDNGDVTVSLMKYPSFDAAKTAIDKMQNLMIGKIK
jgi:hypothetical protein